jgi:antitoxin CcdA
MQAALTHTRLRAYAVRMEHTPIRPRQRVNLTLDPDLLAAARDLGLNLSQELERTLAVRTREERARRWKADNAEWIQAHHAWVDAHELPLERYRLF